MENKKNALNKKRYFTYLFILVAFGSWAIFEVSNKLPLEENPISQIIGTILLISLVANLVFTIGDKNNYGTMEK